MTADPSPAETRDPRAVPAHLAPVVGDAPVYTITDLYQGRDGVDGILKRVLGWGQPWVVGEVTDLKPRNDHLTFALRDDGARLDAFVHARIASKLGFTLENGLAIIARIRFDVFPGTGRIQGVVQELVPRDKGPRQLAFEQALGRLTAEGLLDPARKRSLPRFPRRIGIVTSSRGKAMDDLVVNLLRRWPRMSIKVWSATVQGEEAVGDLIRGIRGFNTHLPQTEVLIVGRGGGSVDDLWAFNDETLARTIAASAIPVVVSLGHTTDRSLAGLVADVDAATPSTAAELVTAVEESAVRQRLEDLERRHRAAIVRQRDELARRVLVLEGRRIFTDLRCLTERAGERLLHLRDRLPRAAAGMTLEPRHRTVLVARSLEDALRARTRDARRRFEELRLRLHGASPLAILERGYAVAERAEDGRTVRAPGDVAAGDAIRLRTHGGDIELEVTP